MWRRASPTPLLGSRPTSAVSSRCANQLTSAPTSSAPSISKSGPGRTEHLVLLQWRLRRSPVRPARHHMVEIRLPRTADAVPCADLAALVIGPERAGAFIKSHLERHHLIVAESAGDIVGLIAYRTDWFECTLVSLVVVKENFRRRGIAREF